jgi:hypothetical protein
MPGKFELYIDNAGKYRFRLKATNGHVLATSQPYSSKRSALEGIEVVKKHAPSAQTVEVGR